MLPTPSTLRQNGTGAPPRLEELIEPETLARIVATTALEKKAHDVTLLDLRGRIDYADIFVLCTATNPRQVVAIADAIRKVCKTEHGLLPNSVEGMQVARWVLVDFGDVVVHIFDRAARGFYDLDGLWSDAERLPAPEVEGADDEALFPFA